MTKEKHFDSSCITNTYTWNLKSGLMESLLFATRKNRFCFHDQFSVRKSYYKRWFKNSVNPTAIIQKGLADEYMMYVCLVLTLKHYEIKENLFSIICYVIQQPLILDRLNQLRLHFKTLHSKGSDVFSFSLYRFVTIPVSTAGMDYVIHGFSHSVGK